MFFSFRERVYFIFNVANEAFPSTHPTITRDRLYTSQYSDNRH